MIVDKNFSIVTPGGCNANCIFCTDSHTRKAAKDYIPNLINTLNRLPRSFESCSITGGEPTTSKSLLSILALVRARGFKRVVLTTNGTRLLALAPALEGLVDHVNVSRHSVQDDENAVIFGTDKVPSTDTLSRAISALSARRIDTTLNVVYTDHNDNLDVSSYVSYAKWVGAGAVCFRYDHSLGCVAETGLERRFSEWKRVQESSCPVCRTHTIIYNGMRVIFKASASEPSNDMGEVYEVIYHITGKLTTDWAGKHGYDYNYEALQNTQGGGHGSDPAGQRGGHGSGPAGCGGRPTGCGGMPTLAPTSVSCGGSC